MKDLRNVSGVYIRPSDAQTLERVKSKGFDAESHFKEIVKEVENKQLVYQEQAEAFAAEYREHLDVIREYEFNDEKILAISIEYEKWRKEQMNKLQEVKNVLKDKHIMDPYQNDRVLLVQEINSVKDKATEKFVKDKKRLEKKYKIAKQMIEENDQRWKEYLATKAQKEVVNG